jgi:acetyl/propionyl-CoA carboxylase alpha subunit
VVFSPNSAFLAATTKSFRVGGSGGNDSLLKNKIYAVSAASHDNDTKVFLAPTAARSKQNEFLLQQNRILINYKKLTHFETCLMRSREFLKKNFDFIHAQIKAQAAAAASSSSTATASLINNNKDKQSKFQKNETEKKTTKKKAKKTKLKKQIKKETKPTGDNEVDFIKEEKETNAIYSLDDFNVDDVKNVSNSDKNTRIDFSRDMIEFTLKTLRVISEIDEVLHIK